MANGGFDLFGGGASTSPAGTAVGSGITALTGAATGNPIALVAGLAGIGMSLFGGLGEAKTQKEEAQVSIGIAEDEQQIQAIKQQQMEATAARQSLESFRKQQQAIAISRASTTAQGAQFGSGAQGAKAQEVAEGAFNQYGIAQNLLLGRQTFAETSDINQKQIQLAQLGGTAATYGGYAAMGQGLTSGAMALGNLSGGFGAKG